jgi:hypothetical protein
MDVTHLQKAFHELLDTAATVADSGETLAPPAGEWNAEQILAHVSVVTAATITTVATVASGANPTYDKRIALDTWTLGRVIAHSGGQTGLRERIRDQGEALCALSAIGVSETELDTRVPTLLLSNDTVMVDQLLPLRDIIGGLADVELPNHAKQLLALLP